MSDDRVRDSDSPTSPVEEEWFEIREVIAERVSRRNKKKKEYRVSWAPNPVTGEIYTPTWVSREDLTESAFEDWQGIKKERLQKEKKEKKATPSKPRPLPPQKSGQQQAKATGDNKQTESSQDQGSTDSSRSVIPADHRRRLRIPQQISPTPDLSDISPNSKGRAPVSTSTSDLDEPFQTPTTSRAVFTIEIKKSRQFDASDYWSVSDSQTTSEALSQPISTLETEDAQIFLGTERVIPDSQEWDSVLQPQSQQRQTQVDEEQPQGGEQQPQRQQQQPQGEGQQPQREEPRSQGERQPAQGDAQILQGNEEQPQGDRGRQRQLVEIPDSQELSSLESQQNSALHVPPSSTNAGDGTSSGSQIPSHQPDVVPQPALQPESISSASSSLPRPSRAESSALQTQASAPERVLPSTLLAQFVSQQLSQILNSPGSARSESIASPLGVQTSQAALSTPSQAAQIIPASSPFVAPLGPLISSQGDSVVPDSIERASEGSRQRPNVWPESPLGQRSSARSFPSSFFNETSHLHTKSWNAMDDGRKKSPAPKSAQELLRLALDPSLSQVLSFNRTVDAPAESAAAAVAAEAQASNSDPILSLGLSATTATLQQPSIQINSPPRLANDPVLSAHTQPPTPSDLGTHHEPASLTHSLPLDASGSMDALGPFLGTDNPAEPYPTTVSPSDISRSIEPDPLPQLDMNADVMDMGLNDPELENVLPGSPRSQEEDADMETTAEPSEFLVTLQLPANIKEFYVDTYNHEKRIIEQFSLLRIDMKPIDPSVVARIDGLMEALYRICDLPATLSNESLVQLPAKDIAKHAMGTNSKLCFVGRLFDKLSTANKKKVLVVARSQELIGYLEAIVASIGDIAYSKTSLDEIHGVHTEDEKDSGLAVVLARSDQHVKDLGEFDVVIAYDNTYPSSKVAEDLRISDVYPADKKRPVVLTLVNTYTIEHFDLAIPERLHSMERRSAMLYALFSSRATLLRFEDELTVEATASLFAEHILEQDLITLADGWRPQEVPQMFLEYDYFDSSQRSQTGNDSTNKLDIEDHQVEEGEKAEETATETLGAESSVIPSEAGRKRKLEDDKDDDKGSKRPRGAESPNGMSNGEPETINEIVHSQLLSQPVEGRSENSEVDILRATISALETQLKEKVDTEALMRKQIARMTTQIKSNEKTTNTIQRRLMDTLVERGTALDAAKKAEEKAQKCMADRQASVDKYAELEKKYCSVVETRGVEDKTFALLTSTEQKLEKAEAEIKSLEQKLKNKDGDLDYVRSTMQTERQSSEQTMRENVELRAQVAKLQEEQAANRVRIQEINAANNTVELGRQVVEAQVLARDREIELDRVKEELRVLKNGRRETRGASVPRSPRMGMMSPRTGRGGVVGTGPGASRGTSPALGGIDGQTGAPPAVPGSQFFNPPSSNGRFNHLRDFV
ncbi:hypothetical protein B0T11DRAFT_280036 [Plectosphaerella cucumerina]|uniref:Chromo domain-containing protein n=1 Tax=Plectosphaerella cucumerina TaxID=40658 RepID=A0A8K0TFZ7_9PEZI|nr:hypothetical protein B0T11DRAFT_280036 [Plectosphaerella cucumerina]